MTQTQTYYLVASQHLPHEAAAPCCLRHCLIEIGPLIDTWCDYVLLEVSVSDAARLLVCGTTDGEMLTARGCTTLLV